MDILKNILQKRLIETTIKKSDKSSQQKTFHTFSIADALIGEKPIITSGGGGGSESDFR